MNVSFYSLIRYRKRQSLDTIEHTFQLCFFLLSRRQEILYLIEKLCLNLL